LFISDAQSAIERLKTRINNLGDPNSWLITTKSLHHTRGIKSTILPSDVALAVVKKEAKVTHGL
jgi:hypothetical protein